MEKKVGAPRGVPSPTPFKLVARGLLKAGKLPPIPLQPFSNRFQKGLEGEEGLRTDHG
jgi:hypothetical protein